MNRRTALTGLILLGLLACAANVPKPTLMDAGNDEAVLEELTAGRRLYASKCGGCHGLYSVERYSDAEWKSNVGKMIALKKVKLGSEEEGRIVRYLTAVNGRD